MSSTTLPAVITTKAAVYGLGGAAIVGVGGYLLGDFLSAVAVGQANAPTVFALGGSVIGFFTGASSTT